MKWFSLLCAGILVFGNCFTVCGQKKTVKEQISFVVIHDKQLSDKINLVQDELAQQVKENRFIGLATLGTVAYNMLMGKLVGGATEGVQKAVNRSQAKYKAEWTASVSKDFFYNNVSFNGPFDPSGMQFGGMKALRLLPDEADPAKADTAFYFACHVNREQIADLIKNSRFGLVMDTLMLDLSKTKAKLPRNRKFNLEVNVSISASWVNQATQYFKDQELGNFRIVLRDIVYDPENPIYVATKTANPWVMDGSCFIVPRSYCGYIDREPGENMAQGKYRNLWGQGEYTMKITVKEETENKSMVKDLFNEYMIKVVETYGNEIKTMYAPGKQGAGTAQSMKK